MDILQFVDEERAKLLAEVGNEPERLITMAYYRHAAEISDKCVTREVQVRESFTNRADAILLHRVFGPLILVGVVYILYYLSIVKGYQLTHYTWPWLASFRNLIISILPKEGLLFDPAIRRMAISVVDGFIAVLNYVPIFVILFSLVAILEDTGYVPRMAFIMDRMFRQFGLHGQSVFPMVLGGVVVGGCAVPGIMATRTIKDQRARIATILVIPLLNCLAKTPLHILLIEMFFQEHRAFAVFFVSTISLIIALTVSKVLSLTVLKSEASAPFLMEMPPYHMPTILGVLQRCWERLWLFFRKIVVVVIPVMVIVFALTSLPGPNTAKQELYLAELERIVGDFQAAVGNESPYARAVSGDNLVELVSFSSEFDQVKKAARSEAGLKKVHRDFMDRNLAFYKISNRGRFELDGVMETDAEATRISRHYRDFERERKALRARLREDVINHSVLGVAGRSLEPITKYAGFDWKVNIALLSSFAAKESSVATLGSIYGLDGRASLEGQVSGVDFGWTDLHALALMVFMVVFPPCIPTLLAVKMETGRTLWMLFAGLYPVALGLVLAGLIYTGGNALGLTGIQAMALFYALAILAMLVLAMINKPDEEVLEN